MAHAVEVALDAHDRRRTPLELQLAREDEPPTVGTRAAETPPPWSISGIGLRLWGSGEGGPAAHQAFSSGILLAAGLCALGGLARR